MLPFLNMFFQSGQFLLNVVVKIYGNIHLVPQTYTHVALIPPSFTK